jgi:multiple sugar transport system substrate-binding protein
MISYRQFLRTVVCIGFFIIMCQNTITAKELLLWGPSQDVYTPELVELFNSSMKEQGRDLRVRLEIIAGSYRGLREKLLVAIAGGAGPDLIEQDVVQWPEMTALGILQPITQELATYPYRQALPPGMLDAAVGPDRDIYGVPYRVSPSLMYANVELLEKIGIPGTVPITWDEMREIVMKSRGLDNAWGMQFRLWWQYLWFPFVWSAGGDFLAADGSQCLINSAAALRALKFWRELYEMQEPTLPQQSGADFAKGDYALAMSGPHQIGQIRQAGDLFRWTNGLIPRPNDGQHSSFLGGHMMGIAANSKYKDEAWEFLRFMLERNTQQAILIKNGHPPARIDMFSGYFSKDSGYLAVGEALVIARIPYSPKYDQFYDPTNKYLGEAIQGKIAPETALAHIETEVNAIINAR